MSALDVSDPHISMAYDALAQNDPLRWFLLAYGNKPNKLSLCASGTGDLDELRAHITPGNVHYGVFREQSNNANVCVSLAVIPDSVGGVRRARAHVHARAISSMFKVTHSRGFTLGANSTQVSVSKFTLNLGIASSTPQTLNASNPNQITVDALRSVLRVPLHGAALTSGSNRPTHTDPPPSHMDSGVNPSSSGLTPTSSGAYPPSSKLFLPSGPSPSSARFSPPSSATPPPSSGSPMPVLAPSSSATPPSSQSRSHRKPPPRLSMPPKAKNSAPAPPHAPHVPSPRLAASSPSAPHASLPSPRSPAAASTPPTQELVAERSRAAPTSSSPHTPITNALSTGDARAQSSFVAKQDAPLPPPPSAASPEGSKPAFEPRSAFESDDDESSEAGFDVRMHGPLLEIGGSGVDAAPAPAPASPIGSIPSEHSKASPPREPSPPPHDERRPTIAVSTDAVPSSSAPRTPAQEEAARARNGWAASGETDQTEDAAPPPTPPIKPAKDAALRELGWGAAPPLRMGDADPPATRRARAATEAAAPPATSLEAPTHRRVGSHDARARFLERASPERLAEERRLAMLDEERRRRAAERRRRAAERAQREREEREEEEARERAFAERKERDRARRVELARQAEERRAEERRREEEARKEREARETREREAREAKEREARARAQEHIERSGAGMELLSGFVTLEMASVWRRRYFRLSTDAWLFFKNDEDVTQPVHVIELGRVRALREWNEGYEELEAIPHSFAVELTDDGPYQCFADSAEDKEILLGLLNQAAGL